MLSQHPFILLLIFVLAFKSSSPSVIPSLSTSSSSSALSHSSTSDLPHSSTSSPSSSDIPLPSQIFDPNTLLGSTGRDGGSSLTGASDTAQEAANSLTNPSALGNSTLPHSSTPSTSSTLPPSSPNSSTSSSTLSSSTLNTTSMTPNSSVNPTLTSPASSGQLGSSPTDSLVNGKLATASTSSNTASHSDGVDALVPVLAAVGGIILVSLAGIFLFRRFGIGRTEKAERRYDGVEKVWQEPEETMGRSLESDAMFLRQLQH